MTLEPDKDPKDGTRVRRENYSAESSPIQVVFYTIEGGGHTIPGGLQYLPERLIGRTSRDLDAGEVIINFFLSQRKS
jgi:polyhydroxybutyrate depolymerase